MTAPTIRLLLVDDHAIVRQGLRSFLELQADMLVVGEGVNGREAVALAQQLHPDVILLDLIMPEMGGVEATRQISAICPTARILILTSFGEDDQVFPAIRAGAHGYLLKDIQPANLIQAVRQAAAGEPQLDPLITRRLMDKIAGEPQARPENAFSPHTLPPGLTERERQVLGLLAEGLNNREIAASLVIGESTVKTHVSSLLDKLGLQDRTQAAIWALKHGLGGPAR